MECGGTRQPRQPHSSAGCGEALDDVLPGSRRAQASACVRQSIRLIACGDDAGHIASWRDCPVRLFICFFLLHLQRVTASGCMSMRAAANWKLTRVQRSCSAGDDRTCEEQHSESSRRDDAQPRCTSAGTQQRTLAAWRLSWLPVDIISTEPSPTCNIPVRRSGTQDSVPAISRPGALFAGRAAALHARDQKHRHTHNPTRLSPSRCTYPLRFCPYSV